MADKVIYRQSDLVLRVAKHYDPQRLDLDAWEPYLDALCGNREYQKEAIRSAVIFLASGRYDSTQDLAVENYEKNPELQKKYPAVSDLTDRLPIRDRLSANIDLATGTGKSYVIYGVAQIMLGLGLVQRVLVLCPSLTIEKGLTEKFLSLASDGELRQAIPQSAVIRNPAVIDANQTIKAGDICVENIHAVYETTGSSIHDSFRSGGADTLVLNDEAHHIYNAPQSVSARSTEGRNIKKWKEFLIRPDVGFRYILGFTGTAYVENEYFSDVIYRYSLRQAIDDRVVKSVEYVQKDDSGGRKYEKFQKIYQNHQRNRTKYSRIKPLTILITRDIRRAKELREELIDFLTEYTAAPREETEKKVLIVTPSSEHQSNVALLDYVDSAENPVEWIVSVSMLTEGWDVKNVFQIVPAEDRAFNSKLLIAQVLGRGLRLPKEYENPQPSVTVFNHDSWSRNIKNLVDEILEIETKIVSSVKFEGERNRHHFVLQNLSYEKEEREETYDEQGKQKDYSRTWEEGIRLVSQTDTVQRRTSYENLAGGAGRQEEYRISYRMTRVADIVNKIRNEFRMRDWEGGILGLGDDEVYSRDKLPPAEKIAEIIRKSMANVGIEGEYLTEENAHKIYQAFSTLFRKKAKNLVQRRKSTEPFSVSTEEMPDASVSLSSFRSDATLFYADDYESAVVNEDQRKVVRDFLEDDNFPKKSLREINPFVFKTPQNLVITSRAPERSFTEELCRTENARHIDSWIKSRDTGFYSVEYSYKIGSHQKQRSFNPDYFIRFERPVSSEGSIPEEGAENGMEQERRDEQRSEESGQTRSGLQDGPVGRTRPDSQDGSDERERKETIYLVVEIKDDGDVSIENRAKYRYGKLHFQQLNEELKRRGLRERYLFHFLSPKDYHVFFQYLRDGRLFSTQENFRCELENLLEEPDGGNGEVER